ncbi:unnamed protein product [Mytilus edulis]|uniref:Reverse transcriptase domain-containing protein n=1 Tax=Mytilus edulis TaxID=6550 RepID=A0A8S3STG4_MYTED|nr:unnamed protein product [Mytilus edulis]
MHSTKLKEELPETEPRAQRRIPLNKRQAIDDEIKKLEKVQYPLVFSLVLVKKKDLSRQMCAEYQKMNYKTIKESYPILRIEDNIDALSGAKRVSVLELSMAYHQVSMNPADTENTAFSIHRSGLYQYVTMPFGLCSLILYLVDIMVFGEKFEEHLVNLQKVFQRLSDA